MEDLVAAAAASEADHWGSPPAGSHIYSQDRLHMPGAQLQQNRRMPQGAGLLKLSTRLATKRMFALVWGACCDGLLHMLSED